MARINESESQNINIRNRNIELIKLQLRSNEYIWIVDDEEFNTDEISFSDSTPVSLFLMVSKTNRELRDVGFYIKPFSNHPKDIKAFDSLVEWGYLDKGLQCRQALTNSSSWVSLDSSFGCFPENRVPLLINKGIITSTSNSPIELRIVYPTYAPSIGGLRFKIAAIFEEENNEY